MNKSKRNQIESLKRSYENMLSTAMDFKRVGDVRLYTEFKISADSLRQQLEALSAA